MGSVIAPGSSELPREVMMLAGSLARIHGDVVVRKESHGTHLYMASPEALERDGDKELLSRHMTVNADKYLGVGRWTARAGTYDRDHVATCHKYGTRYAVSDLLKMLPLEQRGISAGSGHKVINASFDREKYLVDDGRGNMVPMGPGKCVPLAGLPAEHPAIVYLRTRDFEPSDLECQFGASYCYEEAPENRAIGLYWKRLPGGFKVTPQGRLILNVDVRGIRQGWQARILEYEAGHFRYFWHPYECKWVPVLVKISQADGGYKWELRPDWARSKFQWKPVKYRSANGIQRAEVLMGFDAAVHANTGYGVIFEGPLDAARLGPPGMAYMGKYLNEGQAHLLASAFPHILFMRDEGSAGDEAAASIVVHLGGRVRLTEVPRPPRYEDPGAMPRDELRALVAHYL